MKDNVTFLVKILILSMILSILIKYGGRLLSINPRITIVIAAILVPTIMMALVLSWRYQKNLSNNQ